MPIDDPVQAQDIQVWDEIPTGQQAAVIWAKGVI